MARLTIGLNLEGLKFLPSRASSFFPMPALLYCVCVIDTGILCIYKYYIFAGREERKSRVLSSCLCCDLRRGKGGFVEMGRSIRVPEVDDFLRTKTFQESEFCQMEN